MSEQDRSAAGSERGVERRTESAAAQAPAGASARPRAASASRKRPGRSPLEKWGLVVLAASTAALVLYVLWRTVPYYLSPLEARPRLEADRTFRPTGTWGHGLGILGGLILAATLLYPLRKRVKRWKRAGRMSTWLRYHIWCGFSAPLFVTLHGAFKFGGLVAISYWSMVAVMVSGIIGRYLYAQIPRSIAGHELGERELSERDAELLARLRESLEADSDLRRDAEHLAGLGGIEGARGLRLLFLSIADDAVRAWHAGLLRRRLRRSGHFSASLADEIASIARKRAVLQRRVAVLHLSRGVFRHWHSVHKPFAYVMFGIAAVHVGVAIFMGYTWIF